jgi:hypothetical protein
MTETIPPRPAGRLAPGDRIAAHFLPNWRAAEVRHVEPYPLVGEPWVMVVCRPSGGAPEPHYWQAGALIPLEALADDGHGYSREADDVTPVSPARVPLHAGGVEGVAAPDTVHVGEQDELIDGRL